MNGLGCTCDIARGTASTTAGKAKVMRYPQDYATLYTDVPCSIPGPGGGEQRFVEVGRQLRGVYTWQVDGQQDVAQDDVVTVKITASEQPKYRVQFPGTFQQVGNRMVTLTEFVA